MNKSTTRTMWWPAKLRGVAVGQWLFGLCLLSALGFGPASPAVEKVREGIRSFAAGEFDAARQAFTAADVSEPENPIIVFDRACVLAATGEIEKARDLFQQAALSRDVALAARSHYNLGCLSAEQGRAILGDDPVAAQAEQRQQGMSHLLSAVGHYRDCLRLAPQHADARHNLELIRLFIKHIQSQWDQQDKKKNREEMNLLEFLAMIEQRQTDLRTATRLYSQEPDSPQRRQAVRETTDSQNELRDELGPLKEKIQEQLQPPTQGQAAGTPPAQPKLDDQTQQAQQLLTQLVDEADTRMRDAATQIDGGKFEPAAMNQREVLDRLNQIFMVVAPFANVLQRATQEQETLVNTSTQYVDATAPGATPQSESPSQPETQSPSQPKAPNKSATNTPTTTAEPPENKSPDITPPSTKSPTAAETAAKPAQPTTADPAVAATAAPAMPLDYPELAWQQSRVTDWSQMLSLKAAAELEALKSQPMPADQTDPQSADPNAPPTANDPAQQAAAQREALQKSLEKAVELAPQVQEHSEAAATHLGDENAATALPDQQTALKLLKEIAEPLAQQNQQQQDGQQDQQADNQQQNKDGDKGQQQQNQPQQQQKQQQNSKSPQDQAMSVLRRARERERRHRDLQKQIQQAIGGRVQVDRDW